MKKAVIAAVALALSFAAVHGYWDDEWEAKAADETYSAASIDDNFLNETSVPKIIGLAVIKLYQLNLSGKTGSDCNFYPSCSRYGFFSIKKFGALKGAIMSTDRVLRCHMNSYTVGYEIDYDHGLLADPVENNDTLNFIFDWLNF